HGPNIYSLSNRNFDIANDSIFIVEITDTINASSSEIKIQVVISDTKYGVPPFARQANDHEFDTNDSRILGGFLENDQIQFVSNTLSPDIGFAAVYHGIIDDVSSNSQLTSYIITDDTLDFGYPNISYTGKQDCDHESIITFNHSSPTNFAGFSAVHYGNNDIHSEVLKIIEGLSYVDRHSGDSGQVYERWGDYSGTQRKYNEPGKIWTTGYYANDQNENGTWVAELQSPDSTIMAISTIDTIDLSQNGLCHGYAVAKIKDGNPPYSYKWNDAASQLDSIALELCDGSYAVTVTDSYNCKLAGEIEIKHPQKEASIFPNPSSNFITMNFELDQDTKIDIMVYDKRGRLVKTFSEASAKKGENLFSFNTEQLSRGLYIVKIQSSSPLKVVAQRFIKL
ncbi:MAG: T9SS type A sorting domain-containing protein, partial [Bacteroidia bacterium]|nr:T9SS type A sorting domain-containing protein [Bacteroidia bacterium]